MGSIRSLPRFALCALLLQACGPAADPDPDAAEDGDAEAPEQTAVLALPAGDRTLRELGFTDGDVGEDGAPDVLFGDWDAQATSPGDLEALLQGPLAGPFQLSADSTYPLERMEPDDERPEVRYFSLQQVHRGIPVDGGGAVFEVDDRGHVYSIVSQLAPGLRVDPTPRVDGSQALHAALSQLGKDGVLLGIPDLRILPAAGPPGQLAWHALVLYTTATTTRSADLYVSAINGAHLGQVPRDADEVQREIHTMRGACSIAPNFRTDLPGARLFGEGEDPRDAEARAVYDNLGHTYGFYQDLLRRNSYDGLDATLLASVHVNFRSAMGCDNTRNAAWYDYPNYQMVYGDATARALDVTGHEVTHGVIFSLTAVEEAPRLRYLYESGALNEAMADIFGAGVEAWRAAQLTGGTPASDADKLLVSADTWRVGQDVTGGAFRSMDRPATFNYTDPQTRAQRPMPDRYNDLRRFGCNFRNRLTCCKDAFDQCGVHINSGIANLAFKLLATGGTHPDGADPRVSAVTMALALRIFYRSRTQWRPDTTFRQMRHITAGAARRYGCGSWRSVQRAWTAVGVPAARVRCPPAR